ncbi:MAG: EndoU domain-containing protein [Sarcina sp.]
MIHKLIIGLIVIIIAVIVFFRLNLFSNSNELKSNETNLQKQYTKNDIYNLQNTHNFLPNSITHILIGTINKIGETEGFHYDNISNSNSYIINGTKTRPNNFGVYKAKVIIDGKNKSNDNGYSTFFPNSMSPQDIVNSINYAYSHRRHIAKNIYIGTSKNDIQIEIYLTDDNKIISAFPKY